MPIVVASRMRRSARATTESTGIVRQMPYCMKDRPGPALPLLLGPCSTKEREQVPVEVESGRAAYLQGLETAVRQAAARPRDNRKQWKMTGKR